MENVYQSDSSRGSTDTLPTRDNANDHIWATKGPTKSNKHPKVVCRQCRSDRNIKFLTNKICVKCGIGLCSQLCYDNYHGLVEGESIRPDQPPVPKTKAELKFYGAETGDDEPSDVDSESDLVLHLSSENGSSSDPSSNYTLHLLDFVPPTKCKPNAQLRCRQCSFEHRPRKDTRYMCSSCKFGMCGRECFENFHTRKGFHIIPAARRQRLQIPETPQKRSSSTRDESAPGPSGTFRHMVLESSTSDDVDSPSSVGSKTHKHVKKPSTPKKKHAQKGCRQCLISGRGRKDTTYVCQGCEGEPGLCSKLCYYSFHRDSETDLMRKRVLRKRRLHSSERPPTPVQKLHKGKQPAKKNPDGSYQTPNSSDISDDE